MLFTSSDEKYHRFAQRGPASFATVEYVAANPNLSTQAIVAANPGGYGAQEIESALSWALDLDFVDVSDAGLHAITGPGTAYLAVT